MVEQSNRYGKIQPIYNQDPFETWTSKTLDCAVPYGTYRVEYGMLLTNAENGGDGAVYIDNVGLNLISLPLSLKQRGASNSCGSMGKR